MKRLALMLLKGRYLLILLAQAKFLTTLIERNGYEVRQVLQWSKQRSCDKNKHYYKMFEHLYTL